MKKIILSIFSLFILTILVSCTNYINSKGSLVTKEFSNNEAESLVIDDSLNIVSKDKSKSFGVINLVEGSERKVEVKTNSGVFDNLKVSTASNKITLSSKTKDTMKADEFIVTITGYNLNAITSNNMTINGSLYGEECVIKASNYSILNLNFNNVSNLTITLDEHSQVISESKFTNTNLKITSDNYSKLYFKNIDSSFNEITANANESSMIVLKGNSTKLVATLSEVATLRCADLTTDRLEITSIGASIAYIKVTSSIKYYLAGSSELYYEGSPTFDEDSYKSTASILKNTLNV